MEGPISWLRKQEASAGLGGNENRRLQLGHNNVDIPVFSPKHWNQKVVLGKGPEIPTHFEEALQHVDGKEKLLPD